MADYSESNTTMDAIVCNGYQDSTQKK